LKKGLGEGLLNLFFAELDKF